MTFESARSIEQTVWQMRLADWPRGQNRALINSLANGAPPYTDKEAAQSGKAINVNDLSLTRLSHDARLQLYQAFNKPGNFFTARTDYGPVHRRMTYGSIVTKELNKRLKRSDNYFECSRSKFALMVMHGIGPSVWEDDCHWCPEPVGIEDVMVPSNTRLTFRNLPFFAVWHGYTAGELARMIQGPNIDPGWNLGVVRQAVKWAEEQTAKLYGGTRWAEYWSPEKAVERIKQDSGVYASDLVQTIDCWDFYFWDDAGKKSGWRRRTIFDAYGGAGAWNGPAGYGARNQLPDKNLLNEEGLYLYDSGDRVWADNLHEIIHFQFADLSSVAPFRYHSVRSLGFLLYAACHLQNRLRCSFSESVFENLMMYLRVNSLDDAERALKIELANRGIIDETVQFLSPQERWQPNPQLAELGLNEYKQVIADNSASYVQNQNFSRDRVEKTKFQVMAEVNAMTTLVSAALQQAYRYSVTEYREIFRRFMCPKSRDHDVQLFRAACLKQKVPEKLLESAECWDIEPERVVGGGNKTMEMAIAQQLMEWRAAYTPQAQQQILRTATLSITDDAALTLSLVPEEEGVSDTKHAAMLAFGSLMAGGVVGFTASQNRIEVVEVLLAELTRALQQTTQLGMLPTAQQVLGFQNVLDHIAGLIGEASQDADQKERVKELADASGRLANEVKGFAQRVGEEQKARMERNGDDGEAAKTQARIAATLALAKAKVDANRESRAERAASRQVEFEQQLEQRRQEHALELQQMAEKHALEAAAEAEKAAVEVEKARNKPGPESSAEGR